MFIAVSFPSTPKLTPRSWDAHYADDLRLQRQDDSTSSASPPPPPLDLASWFDDVDAPARTLAFLTSSTFPLSPNHSNNDDAKRQRQEPPSVLDLGTGNGGTLFQLRLSGNWTGPMLGVDYSPYSIQLARTLAQRYDAASSTTGPANNPCAADIHFQVLDLIHSNPATQPWWPGAFDLVLDKGTFDAISLSPETIAAPDGGSTPQRVCEVYPAKVADMVKPGGFLLVTSCNWTEDEVVHWFTGSHGAVGRRFEVWATVKYPRYTFGGHEGQGVATVCFRRVS